MSDTTAPSSAEGGEDHSSTDHQMKSLVPPSAAHFSVAVVLVALGDLALYSVTPGAAAGLFSAALVVSVAGLNSSLLSRRAGWIIGGLLLGGCAAFVEEPSYLALGLGIAGLAGLVVSTQKGVTENAAIWLERGCAFLMTGLFRLPIDLFHMPSWASRQRWSKSVATAGWVWLVPLSMTLVFLALFSYANPILARWIETVLSLNNANFSLPDAVRIGFWLVLAVFVWAFLRGNINSTEEQRKDTVAPKISDGELVTNAIRKGLLSPAAVCRSLIMFNAVFALQNALDLRYLWAQEALPEGVTYASYAHAGTYPLAISALLAATFVLLAFPSRLRNRGSWTASLLMYLWMAQSVFLVASAMARMALYIDAYALTYLRIIGLVVMVLIAAGLVLIALRIALAKSNVWLINASALLLIATLYTACFVNFDRVIADYNVANCREMGGNGFTLDVPYLKSLGPSVLPALQRFETNPRTLGSPKSWLIKKTRSKLSAELLRRQSDWRSWTYRGHRLIAESGAP